MDENLITTFREKANENDYCYRTYSRYNGKNLWNCICSAMDWITVGVSNISFRPDTEFLGHRSETTIEVLTLLMRIAMIKEGIEQLHRVIFETNEIYLNKDISVWTDNQFGLTDNEYFETLCACFGAHPVNLKGFKGLKNEERRFSSWSFCGLGKFTVILYPSTIMGEDISIEISFEQLEQYIEKRYFHLTELTNLLEQKIQTESIVE
jgi:hypothetical protein